MKLIQSVIVIIGGLFFSGSIFAGVYKCSDGQGNTSYQARPCAEEKKAIEINVKTGGAIDLSLKEKEDKKEKELDAEQKKQLEANNQKSIELEEKRKKDTAEQSALNQQLIKDNPIQYSAFAIPPYRSDRMPPIVKLYQSRLPEIEKFRRYAAKKALATGECLRVESDELSGKSSPEQLVFSVDCSSAQTFYFNEKELTE
ncbi:MAG: DUF4124 domain-containing protein [Methylococcales bacterium]|nr:DUF4124 domain-containing protein [Methylococcales bacterium]